jgi:hypothetical protein
MNPSMAQRHTTLPDCEQRRLTSDLFHALSQPLTALCCSLELTLQLDPTLEKYRDSVACALGQAERVSSLATGIRELFDAAETGDDNEVLPLQATVHDAVRDSLPLAELAGVQICFLSRSECPVCFGAQRMRRGLFHLLGFVLGLGCGGIVKIELTDIGTEAVLSLLVSAQIASYEISSKTPTEDVQARELSRRLALGIARATFEAVGGSLRIEYGLERVSLEIRLPRMGTE